MKIRRILSGILAAAVAFTGLAGVGSADVRADAAVITEGKIVMASLGYAHSGALDEEGSLYMWGYNIYGQVGDSTIADVETPKKILENVKTFCLGHKFSAAVNDDGELYTWGYNNLGVLGIGSVSAKNTPVKVELENVASISCGGSHMAAITEKGELYVWGGNTYGQLGDGSSADSYKPKLLMSGVKAARLGYDHSAALKDDGTLWVWGSNSHGQVGSGSASTKQATPVQVMSDVVSFDLGEYTTAAVDKNGDLYAWGHADSGAVGSGSSKEDVLEPKKILSGVKTVSMGRKHGLAVSAKGELYAWGLGGNGQLFFAPRGSVYSPEKVSLDIEVVFAACGESHSGVISKEGRLYLCGWNGYHQIGDGIKQNHQSATFIIGPELPPPPKPALIKSAAGDGQATVTCSTVKGAKTYRLFYTVNNGVSYKKVGDTDTRKWVVTGLKNGTEYKFLVLACNGEKWSTYKKGECYAEVTPKAPGIAKPTTVKATAGVKKAVVTCSTVKGAKTYRLFYTTDNGKSYKKVGDTDTRKWTVTGLKSGAVYKFLVLAYDGKNWSKYQKGECYAEVTIK